MNERRLGLNDYVAWQAVVTAAEEAQKVAMATPEWKVYEGTVAAVQKLAAAFGLPPDILGFKGELEVLTKQGVPISPQDRGQPVLHGELPVVVHPVPPEEQWLHDLGKEPEKAKANNKRADLG